MPSRYIDKKNTVIRALRDTPYMAETSDQRAQDPGEESVAGTTRGTKIFFFATEEELSSFVARNRRQFQARKITEKDL